MGKELERKDDVDPICPHCQAGVKTVWHQVIKGAFGKRHLYFCSQCRKVQGSAFATNGNVDKENFRFVSGENELTGYEANSDQTKYFCKHCGSPIMSVKKSEPDVVRIRLGTIESDITERPEAHIFVASKANWEEICGDIPKYDEFEPGRPR